MNLIMLPLASQWQTHLARLSRNAYRHPRVLWLATTKREYHRSSGLSRRQHNLRWVPLLMASATGTNASTVKSNHNHTLCSSAQRGSTTNRRRRFLPPPVGISARDFSSSSSSSINAASATTSTGDMYDENDDLPTSYSDDCPLCAKYSAGPCGTLFRQWLACTDTAAATNKGSSDDDDDNEHVTLCAKGFDRLQACLEEHSDYYDKIHVGGDQEEGMDDSGAAGKTTDSVQQAWETMIQEELAGAATDSFPEALRPNVRIRPKTGQATASFVVSSSSKGVDNFVLAFVRDVRKVDDDADGNGVDAYTLLAAGAKEDLYIDADADDPRIVLALRVPADSAAVIVSAVYEQQDDSVVVYEYRVNTVAVDAADEGS